MAIVDAELDDVLITSVNIGEGCILNRVIVCCFCQAEDGIRYLVRSRGLGDVYKRQEIRHSMMSAVYIRGTDEERDQSAEGIQFVRCLMHCLLYTSDAADERSSVDLGGRRIIKKKNNLTHFVCTCLII